MSGEGATRRPRLAMRTQPRKPSGSRDESARLREPLDVLLVEDDRTDAALMRELLGRSRHFDFRVEHVPDIDGARQALAATHFDLMVLDFWVGGESSLSLLKRSLQQTWNMPALLVSSVDVADVQGLGLEAGAYGYLHKNDLAPSTLDAVIRTLLHSRASEANLRRSLADNVRDQDKLVETMTDMTQEVISTIDNVRHFGEALMKPEAERPAKLDVRSHAAAVGEGTRRLAEILETRLGRARPADAPTQLKLEPVDVVETLRSVGAIMTPKCEDKEQDLSIVSKDRGITCEADAAALHQLFLNLVENAHRFSPRKTRIDVIARQTDNWLRVSVIDQGVGMSKDAIAEAMRRRAYPDLPPDFMAAGHGFGLAVAIAIVDMHGGSVEFESHEDWGTTIVVGLPLTRHRLN